MKSNYLSWAIALLFTSIIAPACSPEKTSLSPAVSTRVVLLTDSTKWRTDRWLRLKKQLSDNGHRVLISGEADESARSLSERLPWLLQPGVDTFYYDLRLAGRAGADTLLARLGAADHPAAVIVVPPGGAE